MNNKKGFTLAELLIVVAIIAVLTMVAVPIFNTQLEKSKEETDIANLRSAKAAAVAAYLAEEAIGTHNFGVNASGTDDNTAYFDASTGVLKDSKAGIAGYGKGKSTVSGGCEAFEGYTETTEASGKVIKVTVAASTGVATMEWEEVAAPVTPNP